MFNNDKENNEEYIKKYKSLNRSVIISMALYLIITLIDLIRNEISVQCMIVSLVFFLSEAISRFNEGKKRTILFIIPAFILTIAMILDYLSEIIN